MPAGAVGDEVECLGRRWIKHRRNALPTRIGDGARRKPGLAVGIVAGDGIKLRPKDTATERLALGDRVDDGRISIELHADPKAIAIDPGDRPPLAGLARFLFDDR